MTSTYESTLSTPRPGSATGRRDPLWLDVALLVAVAVVVCLVSLPRLRGFAVDGNERDAQMTMGLLAAEVGSPADGLAQEGLVALIDGAPLIAHRLRDRRVGEAPGVVEHHGYCFGLEGGLLVAWPVEHGRTGRAAFRRAAGGDLEWHPNPGRWSGAAAAGQAFDGDGWRVLRASQR